MSQCKKFAPNIFHKTKCSNCFRQKEEHSAEALECNRVSPATFLQHIVKYRNHNFFYVYSFITCATTTLLKCIIYNIYFLQHVYVVNYTKVIEIIGIFKPLRSMGVLRNTCLISLFIKRIITKIKVRITTSKYILKFN